jgi:hypothetical protein
MEDARGPRDIYTVPSFADLWPQLTTMITCYLALNTLGFTVTKALLYFQYEAPVRIYLTNAGIEFFHACNLPTVNQSLIVFFVLALICYRINDCEKKQCHKKQKKVANFELDKLSQWLAKTYTDSQDDAGPVGAASQDDAGPVGAASQDDTGPVGAASQDDAGTVSILPRKQTRKKTNKTMFLMNPIEDLFVMLGHILCFLIGIILMPNVSADSLLEFLRTEDQQNQFSFFVLLIILTRPYYITALESS